MEECCGNCHFSNRLQALQPLIRCRRRAPVVLSFGVIPRQNSVTKQVEPYPFADTYFPTLMDTEWCGEWTRRRSPMSAISLDKLDVTELEGNA